MKLAFFVHLIAVAAIVSNHEVVAVFCRASPGFGTDSEVRQQVVATQVSSESQILPMLAGPLLKGVIGGVQEGMKKMKEEKEAEEAQRAAAEHAAFLERERQMEGFKRTIDRAK